LITASVGDRRGKKKGRARSLSLSWRLFATEGGGKGGAPQSGTEEGKGGGKATILFFLVQERGEDLLLLTEKRRKKGGESRGLAFLSVLQMEKRGRNASRPATGVWRGPEEEREREKRTVTHPPILA